MPFVIFAIYCIIFQTIASSENHEMKLISPFSVSVFMNSLYIADSKNKEIWRVDAASGKPVDLNQQFRPEALVKHVFVSNLLGLRIIHPLVQSVQNEGRFFYILAVYRKRVTAKLYKVNFQKIFESEIFLAVVEFINFLHIM